MSSYFSRIFSRPAIAAAALAIGFLHVPGYAHLAAQRFNQPEQRDQYGRLTVEASVITVVNCNGAGENGGQFYVYQYVNRPGFRAIRPPNWGQAIGGRDWGSYDQAASAACGGGSTGNSGNLTGSWQLTTSCGFTTPAWSATLYLTESAGGALSATTSNDKLTAKQVGPDPAPDSWGSKMRSQVSGSTFNLLLHPQGWLSVLEFTGTVSGSRIDGRIHHYTNDDCNFAMTRQ